GCFVGRDSIQVRPSLDHNQSIEFFIEGTTISIHRWSLKLWRSRKDFYMDANQGISNLWVCSDNLTLIGVINNKTQRNELLGIIKDIHDLSFVFVSIAFFFI
ncbi:unnamed protein product, partial [Brassica rapa]